MFTAYIPIPLLPSDSSSFSFSFSSCYCSSALLPLALQLSEILGRPQALARNDDPPSLCALGEGEGEGLRDGHALRVAFSLCSSTYATTFLDALLAGL